MADWLRSLRNRDDDNIVVHPDLENEIELGEERQYVSPVIKEDLARITSIFLPALGTKFVLIAIGLFWPSWLTALINQVGLDSLIVFSCAVWIVASGRFLVGLGVIGIVVLSQLLIIGGLIERNMLGIGRAIAIDAISFSAGALLALFFRRW